MCNSEINNNSGNAVRLEAMEAVVDDVGADDIGGAQQDVADPRDVVDIGRRAIVEVNSR